MCQAFEAERRVVLYIEKMERKKGYEAYHKGISRNDKPDPYFQKSWKLGWDLAQKGKELF